MQSKEHNKTTQLEIMLLLEAIFQQYGYDFRHYASASLARRIDNQLRRQKIKHVSELIPIILYNKDAFELFLQEMSITVTDMFRNPLFFKELRETVIPKLKTWPFVKIWCAGCATGEEVYSLAVLLQEENFYDRCQIYATDYNKRSLAIAKDGIYAMSKIKNYTTNYNNSGAKGSFADYYHAKYDGAKMNESLKRNIVFSHHNLVSDSAFGEMNLILCRNVLIYFNQKLQNRVLNLFEESLCPGGFLCLGAKESLNFTSVTNKFETVASKKNIFRKKYHLHEKTLG
ncbi:MAG: protein-glutamate O-methyltransferase CheR [Desulfobulbaceae bacterium]|nr:protein-glutamate O-methyltransferase CheR [Desulfobulbaceae bacterium]